MSLDITEKPMLSYIFRWLHLQNITNNIFLMLKKHAVHPLSKNIFLETQEHLITKLIYIVNRL